MIAALRALFGPSSQSPAERRPSTRKARYTPEVLEGRQLLTVTYHGGPVMPQVQVQGLYLGSDWQSNSTYNQQSGYLDGFLKTIVNSPYMDALNGAGYDVGRGSASQGMIDPVVLNKSVYLTDAAIQGYVQSGITQSWLQAPNSNRLYVVYVEDNVAVQRTPGVTSQNDFLGYHGSFMGTDASGHSAAIRYAVITYPGDSVGNQSISYVTTNGDLTETTSHELAEAVTDPDYTLNLPGWYDGSPSEEVGDLTAGQTVYLDGYAVQRIADKNDQAMTPAGAVASQPASFVVLSGGYLYEHTAAGWVYLTNNVSRVSNQSIDLEGHAMIDVVFTNGTADEYHDGGTWVGLTSNVKDAEAGQGVSWVLLNNGQLEEYHDALRSPAFWTSIATGVGSIDAGTDRYGVNSVDAIATNGAAYELTNDLYNVSLGTGVAAVSAGRMGVTEILLTNGNAYDYREATNTTTFLASNVAQVTAGSDASGNPMIDLLYTNGNLWEYQVSTGWTSLGGGVRAISKARAGLVDVLFTNGNAYEHSSGGWYGLTGNAVEAV
jgi:hypothetical protein